MIEEYVNKLIENLPIKEYGTIDVVLDGGIFNGSYLVGALYFLKEMEKRGFIKIARISGCSIGSVVALLYYIDALDMMPYLYGIVNNEFKQSLTLQTIKEFKYHISKRIPDDICSRVNQRLFICYNDMKTGKKAVKSVYKSVDQIFDAITRSCFIPFFIDNNMLYRGRYVDGINAYIFKPSKHRILHMELFGLDKITYSVNIKNEKTNYHRIMSGLLDIHSFFIKGTSTPMCSFVDKWNTVNRMNYSIKLFMERISLWILRCMIYVKYYVPDDIKDTIGYKIISRIVFDIFSIVLHTYCL